MKINLRAANYFQFRDAMNQIHAAHIKKHGDTTLVYSAQKHIVAAIKAARIDASGQCQPVAYYINA